MSNPTVTVVDGNTIGNPEVIAMIQAFYSRSHTPIKERLEELGSTEEKIKNSLKKVYLGYGHASVADMGFVSLFIEGISHQACKAIQAHRLGNFQESSTRYIDYSQQGFYNPYEDPNFIKKFGYHKMESKQAQEIIREWLALYLRWTPRIQEGLKRRYHRKEEEKQATWERAIKARAFDIMRGFLPIAVHTQTSWTTNLRQLRDQLQRLLVHPLNEVRGIAENAWKALHSKYPNSFEPLQEILLHKRTQYNERHNLALNYYLESPIAKTMLGHDKEYILSFYREPGEGKENSDPVKIFPNLEVLKFDYTQFDFDRFYKCLSDIDGLDMLTDRPKGVEMPSFLESFGNITVKYSLDFGSWRDIQRHRNAIQPTPLIHPNHFNQYSRWYLEEVRASLTEEEHERFLEELGTQEYRIKKFHLNCGIQYGSAFVLYMQYLYPLAARVQASITCSLPELVYITELRSSPMVHPTLRDLALSIGSSIERTFDHRFPVHLDRSASSWDVRRGDQTIKSKEDSE